MDPESWYWLVGYSEIVAKTVAFVLVGAYDKYRIWRPSHQIIEFMHNLSLKPVLESN